MHVYFATYLYDREIIIENFISKSLTISQHTPLLQIKQVEHFICTVHIIIQHHNYMHALQVLICGIIVKPDYNALQGIYYQTRLQSSLQIQNEDVAIR